MFISEKKLSSKEGEASTEDILTTVDLEAICQKIVKGDEFVGELEVIKTKYNRRPPHVKIDYAQNLFTLVNELIKNTKDVKTLRDIVMSKEDKIK